MLALAFFLRRLGFGFALSLRRLGFQIALALFAFTFLYECLCFGFALSLRRLGFQIALALFAFTFLYECLCFGFALALLTLARLLLLAFALQAVELRRLGFRLARLHGANLLLLAQEDGILHRCLFSVSGFIIDVDRREHRRRNLVARRLFFHIGDSLANGGVKLVARSRELSRELWRARDLRKSLREVQTKRLSTFGRGEQTPVHGAVIRRDDETDELFERRERRVGF